MPCEYPECGCETEWCRASKEPKVFMTYSQELTNAMAILAEHPKTLFVGQAVRFDGQAAYATFKDVPMDKRIEMPVCEDFQMGFCTGLAMQGFIPVSFYPRFDFLIMALNHLVNHLDKIPLMGGFRPKVIIRTAVGRSTPLNPGPQHTQNHTTALNLMLRTVRVFELFDTAHILPAYRYALAAKHSTLLVEHMESYG
jgi:pyruvate/2-oxoglutarate/acetoin dehydrogenase E1 component